MVHARPASLAEPPPIVEPLSLLQKLVPLAVIFFCATFNHTILVNLKVGVQLSHALHHAVPVDAQCSMHPTNVVDHIQLHGLCQSH